MGYCKHQWEDRTAVLREVFRDDTERRTHDFFVCLKCLRINELGAVAPSPKASSEVAA
jgi:hypothetical protein